MILALIAAVVVYPVLRPATQDTCASEILINGRGGKVDVTAKTISLGAESQPVPLEKMTSDSQVLIDQLARLCRQNAEGQISNDQYFAEVDKLLRPAEKASAQPAALKIPQFNGTIGVTGMVDNRSFRKFVEDNSGKIVDLHLKIDGSFYGNLGDYFLQKCYGVDADHPGGNFPQSMDNIFGRQLMLIETNHDVNDPEVNDEQKKISCGPTIVFDSKNRNLNWSVAGTGIGFANIDGFFRESTTFMGTTTTYRFEEVEGSVSDYAQAQ